MMSTHDSGKYFADQSVAWLHVLVIALIIFVLNVSLTLRVVLFIVASILLVFVMWPSRSTHSSHR